MRKKWLGVVVFMILWWAPAFATGGSEVSDAAASSVEEPVKMDILTSHFVWGDVREDQMTFEVVQEKLNIDINFQIVNNSEYDQKLNLLIASDSLPDVFRSARNLTVMNRYYDEGIFAELTDLIATHGMNIQRAYENEGPAVVRNWKDDDGRIWFVAGLESIKPSPFILIYKPWLDRLGLDVPETTEELHEALRGFATLGDDIIPWVKGFVDAGRPLEWAFLAFGTHDTWHYFGGDDYVFGPYERADRMREALRYLKELRDEGLMDQEIFTRSNDDSVTVVKNQGAGFTSGNMNGMWRVDPDGNDIYPPESDWMMIEPLEGPHGDRQARAPTVMGVAGAVMFVSGKYEYPDRAVDMFDYIFSPEGQELFSWGLEGQTYEVVNGQRRFTDAILKGEGSGVTVARRDFGMVPVRFPVSTGQGFIELSRAGNPYYVEQLSKYYDFQPPMQPVLTFSASDASREATIMADVKTYVSESIAKFIFGQLSLDTDWDVFQNQLREMDIEEAIEIRSAAFDRWRAR